MTTLLSVNNYHYRRGGAETVFLEQGRLLEERGWQVVPFCMRHPKNLPSPWEQHFVDEIEFGRSYSLVRKAAMAAKVIYSFEARRRLARLIDLARPDVCHAHNIYNHISPSILGLLKQRGIPSVLTLHDLKIACPAYNMLSHDMICERCKGGRFSQALLNRCVKNSAVLSAVVMLEAVVHAKLKTYQRFVDRFVVPSRFYAEKFAEWGFDRQRFVHVPNFVEVDSLTPEYVPGAYFIYFGRLSPEKGVSTLIRGAAAAKVRVVIAGTGPQEAELRALADRLQAHVDFVGFRTGDDLHGLVRNSRAVVLPSEWYENAPMSVLEAYGLGKPVIAADIGGIPELIEEGRTGVLFGSRDVEALTSALRRLQDFPDIELSEWGRAGRALVQTRYSSANYVSRLMEIYQRLGVRTN